MSVLKLLATYRFSRYFKLGFLIWDIVLLNTAIAFSFLFQYGYFHIGDVKAVRAVFLLSNIFWIMLLLYKDSYRIIRTERIEAILYRTIRILLIHMAIIALFILVLNYNEISRLRMINFYSIFFVLLVSFRIFFMKILKYIRSKGYNFRKVVIVGANVTGERMNRILSKDLTYGFRVMGFFDDEVDATIVLKAPILGKFEDIEHYLTIEKIDELFVALHISEID